MVKKVGIRYTFSMLMVHGASPPVAAGSPYKKAHRSRRDFKYL